MGLFRRRFSLPKTPDGRKYRMGITMMLVMIASFGLAGLNPMLAKLFPDFLTGLAMIYVTYCGGNIGKHWVNGKKEEPAQLPPGE